MSNSLTPLRAQVRAFLAGGPFSSLWAAVMDASGTVDLDESLPEGELEWFDELYDAVYMAADDPVDDRSRKDGIVGASELREQLRSARWAGF